MARPNELNFQTVAGQTRWLDYLCLPTSHGGTHQHLWEDASLIGPSFSKGDTEDDVADLAAPAQKLTVTAEIN